MRFTGPLILVVQGLFVSACANAPAAHDPSQDYGYMWVKHAAEYQALAAQVFRDATDDLPAYISDKSWSAMPGYGGMSELPPAIILDIDETVINNIDFQLAYERPYSNHKRDAWSKNHDSVAIPGAKQFVEAARKAGVTVFFVTGRPCEPLEGIDDPCPQKQTTIDDITELGIDVNPEHLMLSDEHPDWDREKLVRRELIAESYRVIMIIGDDLTDFVPCSRKKIHTPCTTGATHATRAEALQTYNDYWGNGWYILPNPMHGSWTSVR